jgi:cell division protease FtsH
MSELTRANTRIIDAERQATRFADVAGYAAVKTEIGEVVDYLRDPGRYRAAGPRGPRGVLMARHRQDPAPRAVAGEAHVPFLSITGSSFVEMFVGVGAARVRGLFQQARDRAPAIVFIDEIDALAARRLAEALPDARLQLVEDVGQHLPRRAPAAVADAVTAFVAAVDSSSSLR